MEALATLGLSPRRRSSTARSSALGGTGVEDLAHRCQLSSAAVGDALVALERQGLVAQSAAVPGRWVAAPPGVALRALVNDRRHELEQAELVAARLAEVHRTDAAGNVHDLVEVVVGASAVGQRFHQLQLGAVEEVCVLVTDQPTAVPATENQAEDIAAARGVRYRIVLERNVLEQTSQAKLVAVMRRNEEVRVERPRAHQARHRRPSHRDGSARRGLPGPGGPRHPLDRARAVARRALRLGVARGVAAAVRLARRRRDRRGAARARRVRPAGALAPHRRRLRCAGRAGSSMSACAPSSGGFARSWTPPAPAAESSWGGPPTRTAGCAGPEPDSPQERAARTRGQSRPLFAQEGTS